MATRCKFTCQSVTKRQHWNQEKRDEKRFLYKAEFTAVYGGSEENAKFFEATPSGNLEIGTYKEDLFEPGVDYFIDITPVVEATSEP